MNIYYAGMLFILSDKKFTEFLAIRSEGPLPDGWLLKNCKEVKVNCIDLNNFTPDQAKERLKEIVFAPSFKD